MKLLLRWCAAYGENAPMNLSSSPPVIALRRVVDNFRTEWNYAQLTPSYSASGAAISGPPSELIPWFCGPIRLGYVSAARARLLAAHLAPTRLQAHRLDWDAFQWTHAARSAALQGALVNLHALGHIPGWRGEQFSFFPVDSATPLLAAERAGFYFLGMRSDAVHVNGFSADGGMWVARRSANKAVDPGFLDNLCAGGVVAGESLQSCLVRELDEEAGIQLEAEHQLSFAGTVEVARARDGGWHVERLYVFNLLLQAQEQPHNRDGEVQEFRLLSAADVQELIATRTFTPDAAAAIARGLDVPSARA